MLIHHFLEYSAAAYPNKIALVHENVRATYAQINTQANQLARWLIDRGSNPGDRIVLLMDNCQEYVVSYYGALKAGAVVAPLSNDIKPDNLRYLLAELDSKLILSSAKFEKVLQETDLSSLGTGALVLKSPNLKWASRPFSVYSWDEFIGTAESANPNLAISESALGSIIFTSGSTGKPKGVMLSHGNLVANVQSICQYLHLTEKDIQMVVLPFFYVMGKSLLNTHFAVGGTVVINNRFAFPTSVVKQMVEERVTGFSGVPSSFAYLLHHSPLVSYRERLDSLRYCSQAGGHMCKQIKEELRRALPQHTKIYLMYGATEAGARLSYLEPDRFDDKKESIGKAIPGVTLRVIDEQGRAVGVGQVGELVASGDNIMQGYWKDPSATAKALRGGWYHTGDQARQDDEGFFYIVGRKDDLLKVGGHRISPIEIEEILMESGLFVEATVFGVPDELLGNRLVGFAVPKKANSEEGSVLSYCLEKLPKYKVPSEIKFVNPLPKNINGKIDRVKCLEMYKANFSRRRV